MVEVLFLAFALSMDAFAVAIELGSKKTHFVVALPIKIGIFFGTFQALMPLIGYLGAKGLLMVTTTYNQWIAFVLLVLIGLKMIYDGMSEGVEDEVQTITHKLLLTLALATSIDAMAAGFSLILLPVHALLACSIIGVVTFLMSIFGAYIGRFVGAWLEGKAEIFGGIVLICIGLKIVLESSI